MATSGGFWRLILAALIVGASAAAPTAPAAQDLDAYLAPPDDRADAPGGHWDRFYDAATARAAIDACLAEQNRPEGDERACLGLTIGVCLSFAINETTQGSIRCAAGELGAWEAVMADALAAAEAKADDGARAAIDRSQAAWAAYRDAACGVWGEVFRGGSLARQIAADCRRDATGRRAIELRDLLGALTI